MTEEAQAGVGLTSLGLSSLSPGRREQVKAANREAILQAARLVFSELGYGATTVRDIIRRTELASGTFYNYFKSKEDVFEALADDSARRFRPVLAAVRAQATDFPGYVEAAYRAYFSFIAAENEPLAQRGLVGRGLIGVRADTPEMSQAFAQVRADLSMIAADAASPLNARDVEYLSAAAIGVAREVGDRMLMQHPFDVDGATRFAVGLMLRGVGLSGP
jgi:AcrR family transcriptional regulator